MTLDWLDLVAFLVGGGSGWFAQYRRGARVLARAIAESVGVAEQRVQSADARVTEATAQLADFRRTSQDQDQQYQQALAYKAKALREAMSARDAVALELLAVKETARKTRSVHPYKRIPVVSSGQAVAVIFEREGVETAHRRVEAGDLDDTLLHPRLAPTEQYSFSHVDTRGRFVYRFERDIPPVGQN